MKALWSLVTPLPLCTEEGAEASCPRCCTDTGRFGQIWGSPDPGQHAHHGPEGCMLPSCSCTVALGKNSGGEEHLFLLYN